MLRKRAVFPIVLAGVAFLSFFCAQISFSQSASPFGILSGSINSSDGKPLEGIGVSARTDRETFTTTVYTDDSGRYVFPSMKAGQYKVWAQAVGFETSKAEAALSDGAKKQVDLTLTPLNDFHKQLSGTEWAASLPEATP